MIVTVVHHTMAGIGEVMTNSLNQVQVGWVALVTVVADQHCLQNCPMLICHWSKY